MRTGAWIVGAAALALLAGCNKAEEKAASAPEAGKAASATASADIAAPVRKAGLWEQTVSTQGFNQVSTICVDAASEKGMAAFGQQMKDAAQCSEQRFHKRLDGGMEFTSTCKMGETGTVTTKGEVTGDFNAHYKMNAVSTTTGAAMAQANGEHQMTMEATRKGPCPADMKPGDIRVAGMPGMPGGMTINPSEMARQGGMTPEKMAQMKAMAEQMKKQAGQ